MEQTVNPKQQASEAIKQAETILVTAGHRPTPDQAAAVLAMMLILRKLGKRVNAVISDQLPHKLNFLALDQLEKQLGGSRDFIIRLGLSKAEIDKLRYTIEDGKLNLFITPFSGSFDKGDVTFDHGQYNYDLAIVLGVPARDRIDKVISAHPEFTAKVPMINIDFHRSNENFAAVNLIDGQAASLCEILAALAESLQVSLDEEIATTLLAGLYASTDRFTAPHTTAKSLTLSAQLIAAGADQPKVVKGLFGHHEPATDHQQQAEKNQQELKKLAELKNPEPQKKEQLPEASAEKAEKAEPPKSEDKPQPTEKMEERPEVIAQPRVEAEGPAEDLESEARIEFELPDHIKSGLASFLEP